MDGVLPSVLGITVLLTSALLLGRSGLASFGTMTDSWQQAEQHSMERLHSDISITSVNRVGGEVDLTVENTGATSVVDFSKVDVVVQYSAGGTSYVKYIAFTAESAPPDDMWGVVAIVNDVIDPRVLNSGESMTMRVQLNPAPDTAGNWLQVTTEQGFSTSTAFD